MTSGLAREHATDARDGGAAWVFVRRRGTHADLARFVSVEAVRRVGLVGGRPEHAHDLDVARNRYEQLRARGIEYGTEPFRPGSQLIRDPALLCWRKVGTCLDLATTYAAMCLEATIQPLLVATGTHILVALAPGRMLQGPSPADPIDLAGFLPAEGEEAGVLEGSGRALAAAIDRGDLVAVECTAATVGGTDFDAALAAGRAQADGTVLLVDVLYLLCHGYEPHDLPSGHVPIRPHVPPDETPFTPFASHTRALADLTARTGTVVLHAPAGHGKSRVARELARAAPLGAAWFLDASGPEALTTGLAAANRAEQAKEAAGLAALDREGFALSALADLGESQLPWIVVLDNAEGDPGQLERLMPAPGEEQLVVITTTSDEWLGVPDVEHVWLDPIPDEEIGARRASDEPDLTPLLALVAGRPLLLVAFDALMHATGWSAEAVAALAPPATEPPDPLRAQRTLWRALRAAPGFGAQELRTSAAAAYLPPDHQPLATFALLEPDGEAAARFLVEHGLLSWEVAAGSGARSALRLHRTFGEAVRADLEADEPELCDAIAVRLAGEPDVQRLLDERGDLTTIERLEERLMRMADDAERARRVPDHPLGIALHGIATLLELHGQTRRSGDVFAVAEAHLDPVEHRVLVADCRHGRARTVNQHHRTEPERLVEAVELARSARRLLLDGQPGGADAVPENADRCLAMEGLLRQKLAAFPGPGETKLELLNEAIAIVEEADERRRHDSRVEPVELARSTFNRAGGRISLAKLDPANAPEHLRRAEAIYTDVLARRRAIYRRDVHPHIAACIAGLGYVAYYRAVLIPTDHAQRSRWLREATAEAVEALAQRSSLEGSIDGDEVAKIAKFLAKVALARAAAPVSSARVQTEIYHEAMDELAGAGVALPAVPLVPSQREELPEAIAAWARSPALMRLVAEFDATVPEGLELGELLAWLEDLSTAWDYRGGRERNLATAPRFTPVRRKVIAAAAEALGLAHRPSEPERPEGSEDSEPPAYDHVLILGGLVRACLARPLHAASLLARGRIRAEQVTALGGFRPIAGDEIGLLERVVGEQVDDEFHAMDAGVRHAFDVATPVAERGEDSDVVGAAWCVREYATAGGLPVRVVAAPSSELGRRANTADTYAWFATQLAELEPGGRILIVTTEIYVPFQHAEAVRMLALPHGVEVDTVGVDPGKVHRALQQRFAPHQYLQEIRSTICALRALHAAL